MCVRPFYIALESFLLRLTDEKGVHTEHSTKPTPVRESLTMDKVPTAVSHSSSTTAAMFRPVPPSLSQRGVLASLPLLSPTVLSLFFFFVDPDALFFFGFREMEGICIKVDPAERLKPSID